MSSISKKQMEKAAVIPFYITGALFFLSLTVLAFLAADSFHGHYFQAHTLALVHIAALGWGTMVIFGAAINSFLLYLKNRCSAIGLPWHLFSRYWAGPSCWPFLSGILKPAGPCFPEARWW